jgi:hypothetical protein
VAVGDPTGVSDEMAPIAIYPLDREIVTNEWDTEEEQWFLTTHLVL